MGYHLTRMIQAGFQKLDRQERVIAVSRFSDHRMKERFESRSISVIQADLHDSASLEALPDVPNLFFLAGVKFGTNSRPELLQQMNEEMPRLVARRYAASGWWLCELAASTPFPHRLQVDPGKPLR